jgi:hypothetical protein
MSTEGKTTTQTGDEILCQTEWAEFRRSRIHGRGGYARQAIPAETDVIEYVGEKISKAESERRCEANNEYIFTGDDTYDIDGNVEWNPARLINHSCEPNCEALTDDDNRIWIVAKRDIAAGEELTFNYNYDLEDFKEHPCQCGAPNCVGFIVAEEFFAQVRQAIGLGNAITHPTSAA